MAIEVTNSKKEGFYMSDNLPEIEMNRDARIYGMLCHLLVLAGYFFPFGNIIGPLAVWLAKKNEHPFVDDQGKESLNFQISMMIYAVALAIISVGLIIVSQAQGWSAIAYTIVLVIACVGLLLIPFVVLAMFIYPIIAAVKANDGIPYRYPFTIKFV